MGLVSSIVLEALESGVLASAANAATFSGFMHFVRLFGGQIGTSAMKPDRHEFGEIFTTTMLWACMFRPAIG